MITELDRYKGQYSNPGPVQKTIEPAQLRIILEKICKKKPKLFNLQKNHGSYTFVEIMEALTQYKISIVLNQGVHPCQRTQQYTTPPVVVYFEFSKLIGLFRKTDKHIVVMLDCFLEIATIRQKVRTKQPYNLCELQISWKGDVARESTKPSC